jgi:DNA-binding LytR/AlgR family response regulator
MILNCAIVDDEPLALDLLQSYVEKTPFLNLKGKYNNAIQAMEALSDGNSVQLLFLDIQMP